MVLPNSLNKLSLTQLETLLNHIKMGKAHLKKYLTSSQIKNLLTLNELSEEQQATVDSNFIEQHSNIIILVNTIFTSILGGSLGFSAFSGFEIATLPILFVMSLLIILIVAILSWLSYKVTKEKGQAAIFHQQLAFLQIKILGIINRKLTEMIKILVDSLNQTVYQIVKNNLPASFSVDIPLFPDELNFKEKIENYLVILNGILTEIKGNKKLALTLNQVLGFSQTIEHLQKLIRDPKWISDIVGFVPNFSQAPPEPVREQPDLESKHLFAILTNPYYAFPKEIAKRKIWGKENYQDILVGLFPTLLGGGASLFVFFTGIPDILKKLDFHFLHNCITCPFARQIELGMFFAITGYFGFSYLYNQRKAFHRDQYLSASQQTIKNQEVSRLELQRRRSGLRKLSYHFEKLNLILKLINYISSSRTLS